MVQYLIIINYSNVPDLKQITMCHGLRQANFDTWNKALKKYEESTASAEEKQHLMSALACSTNTTTLNTYLDYTLDKLNINDTIKVTETILGNSEIGVEAVLDFLNRRSFAISRKM